MCDSDVCDVSAVDSPYPIYKDWLNSFVEMIPIRSIVGLVSGSG